MCTAVVLKSAKSRNTAKNFAGARFDWIYQKWPDAEPARAGAETSLERIRSIGVAKASNIGSKAVITLMVCLTGAED